MAAERSPILSEVRATLGIAAPLAAANLAQMAMGITNTIMVGELGAAPLAAAGLGGMLFYMMAMLCQGVLSAVCHWQHTRSAPTTTRPRGVSPAPG